MFLYYFYHFLLFCLVISCFKFNIVNFYTWLHRDIFILWLDIFISYLWSRLSILILQLINYKIIHHNF